MKTAHIHTQFENAIHSMQDGINDVFDNIEDDHTTLHVSDSLRSFLKMLPQYNWGTDVIEHHGRKIKVIVDNNLCTSNYFLT